MTTQQRSGTSAQDHRARPGAQSDSSKRMKPPLRLRYSGLGDIRLHRSKSRPGSITWGYKSLKKTILSIVGALVLMAGLVPFGVQTAAQADPNCAPYALVPLRGSGEGASPQDYNPGPKTNGWEGPTLARVLDRFYSGNPALASTPIVEVGSAYKAVPVDIPREALNDYLPNSPVYTSSLTGTSATLQAISNFRFRDTRGCKSTRFILIGYSQGAMVARDVAQSVPSLVAGVYLVGDPWQKPNASGVTGAGANGQGLFRLNYPGARSKVDPYYDGVYAKHSICHNNDPVCDFTPSTDFSPHTNYFTNEAEAVDEADALAGLFGDVGPDPGATEALNVAFVVDTTGSMSPYIANARANITEISQSVLRTSPNSKFSLVEYKDYGDPFIARTVVPLTGDEGALSSGVATLGANGGGDTPESVFSGIVEGTRTLQGNRGTSAVVVLRDAPPHDPEPWSGLSSSSVQRILLGIDPVPPASESVSRLTRQALPPAGNREQRPGLATADEVARVAPNPLPTSRAANEAATFPATLLYDVNARGASSDVVGSIVDATGGRNFGINSPGEVTSSILEAVNDAGEAPTAVLGAPALAIAGDELSIAGLASGGTPPLEFAFDFESDGIADVTSSEGVTSHAYALPGTYKITLTVKDERGRTSTTTLDVDVQGPTALPNEGREQEAPSGGSSGPVIVLPSFGSS